jgi:hypothetical protein
MARYERDPRATAGAPPTPDGAPAKVTMALGADGKWHAVTPPRELVAEQEQRPKPPTGDDPRTAFERNAPPYGAV